MGVIAFCSWSGGKDSCLALYRSRLVSHRILALFSMLQEDGILSRSHGLSREMLESQAQALGIPIRFGKSSWEEYEQSFKIEVERLKKKGVNSGIFGDIDLEAHREWVERVCSELGIRPLLPLWKEERKSLARELVDLGFQAVIISIRENAMSPGWLGETFTLEAIDRLEEEGIDPTGEDGEFHTFVFDGPLFRFPVKFKVGEISRRDGHLQLSLHPLN